MVISRSARRLFNPSYQQSDYPIYLLSGQRIEDDYLVDPVQEFGPERPLQSVLNRRTEANALIPTAANESEFSLRLASAQVAGHDD